MRYTGATFPAAGTIGQKRQSEVNVLSAQRMQRNDRDHSVNTRATPGTCGKQMKCRENSNTLGNPSPLRLSIARQSFRRDGMMDSMKSREASRLNRIRAHETCGSLKTAIKLADIRQMAHGRQMAAPNQSCMRQASARRWLQCLVGVRAYNRTRCNVDRNRFGVRGCIAPRQGLGR